MSSKKQDLPKIGSLFLLPGIKRICQVSSFKEINKEIMVKWISTSGIWSGRISLSEFDRKAQIIK